MRNICKVKKELFVVKMYLLSDLLDNSKKNMKFIWKIKNTKIPKCGMGADFDQRHKIICNTRQQCQRKKQDTSTESVDGTRKKGVNQRPKYSAAIFLKFIQPVWIGSIERVVVTFTSSIVDHYNCSVGQPSPVRILPLPVILYLSR